MKLMSNLLVTILLFASMSCGKEVMDTPDVSVVPMPEPEMPEPENQDSMYHFNDVFEFVADMGVGWNLGNSFDVTSRDKTQWGNPTPTRDMIDAVKAMGFKTLRVPVTWGFHQSETAPYAIESSYINAVQKVVEYGLDNDMHVIINVHHDNHWVLPRREDAEEVKARLGSLWTQVSNHFSGYNQKLIFETLNEPRLEGIPEEWSGGTAEGRALINDYNKVAVDAIRATGGNNESRFIMIPTWAASTVPAAMDDLIVPNDDPNIIISLHTYFPWPFAGEGNQTWGSDADKLALQNEFDRIVKKWITENNRPVILGEWGTIDKNSVQSRLDYADFYAKEAFNRGMLTIVWDDGGMFGLYDRNNLTWRFGNIASRIVSSSAK